MLSGSRPTLCRAGLSEDKKGEGLKGWAPRMTAGTWPFPAPELCPNPTRDTLPPALLPHRSPPPSHTGQVTPYHDAICHQLGGQPTIQAPTTKCSNLYTHGHFHRVEGRGPQPWTTDGYWSRLGTCPHNRRRAACKGGKLQLYLQPLPMDRITA